MNRYMSPFGMGGWQVTEDERQRLETSNRQHQDRLQKLDSQRASPRTLLDVSASAPLLPLLCRTPLLLVACTALISLDLMHSVFIPE